MFEIRSLRTLQRSSRVYIRCIHNDTLRNFIDQNRLISKSTVFQGNLYEFTVLRELDEKLGMINLSKVGGAHDGGRDIKGMWPIFQLYEEKISNGNATSNLENIPKRTRVNGSLLKPLIHKYNEHATDTILPALKVLIQCKALSTTKVSPKELRELIGTFSSMVDSKHKNTTIAMMCSPHLLTKDGLTLINNIKMPLIYTRIEMLRPIGDNIYDIENSGKLINYYENEYAEQLLQGFGIKNWINE
ncbi:hypothetical protein NCAS_0B00830 [Naumovozyma castellii]|uniref:Required for respiratory growth protein 7, mitochondrial n=1 Tax=Naumovozyma castellii TaxID=27288 RepID=G0VB44_NAUCA|nr:hypothetical protein NCAS_0B00830 [Naumovozyma castellii CBS 4309]CCC68167.1 hypothetical protein NCAS_0B00830 [Naumovozyma castellii CBS 4309]